jgi:transmembrane secretion effector
MTLPVTGERNARASVDARHRSRKHLAMPGSDVRDASAWAPFRHPVFRALWIAQFVSNVGTWMQSVGAVWVMVELKGSPTEVVLVQTATTLPVVLFGIAGGALADLADRRAGPAHRRR